MIYKNYLLYILFVCTGLTTHAQIDSSLLKNYAADSGTNNPMNVDAIYQRPFIQIDKFPVSIGGYIEMNWQHSATNGITEGHQLQMRRMTLFVASTINTRIKFLSELELEEGGKELAIEFAAIDLEIHPLLNARAGIIMNPIGSFNQNHDGPKWEFTDRPISSTQLLPATWSNAGVGLYGKYYSNKWMFAYETYVSGGFDQSIIENSFNKTYLPAAKKNVERFEEGNLLLTTKLAIRRDVIGELGLSYMSGIYNHYMEDGLILDKKRYCRVYAIDYNTQLPVTGTQLNTEWTWINIDIPEAYSQQFGKKQMGGYIDIIQPIRKGKFMFWNNSVFNIGIRLEYVDWNVGQFKEVASEIGDELWSIMPSISFRPSVQTVLRLNYRYLEQKDLFRNAPSKTGTWSLGLSSYF
jgi:hypothetical protein